MSHRFFLDSVPTEGPLILEGDQAHHAIQVMRFRSGDEVVLFDGSGVEYRAVIDSVEKKRLCLSIVESISIQRSVTSQITLAVALPKGDRQKFLVEKLVELGVKRLVPLRATRSVAVASDKVIERLKKQVVEASKQCGRNTLMDIGNEQSLKQLGDSCISNTTRLIADPYQGLSISEVASGLPESASVVIAVGPEGGFDDEENALAHELGFEPMRLGPAILRVETAALAVAAIFGIGAER